MEHFNRDSNGMITTGKAVTTDSGRKPVSVMTDREIAEETLATMRATQDLVTKFLADFARNPMFGTLSKMLGR